MKLFIDARMLGNSGIGRYLQNIIEKMDPLVPEIDIQPTVFLNSGDEKYLGPLDHTSLVYPLSHTNIYGLKEQIMLTYYLSAWKPDLVHFPNFNVSLKKKFPFVVTIHDLIYLKYPGACPNIVARFYAAFMIGFACRQAKLIITDSQYSKQDLMNTIHVPEAKIRVIYPAVDPKYQPVKNPRSQLEKYDLPEKYILYVGNHEKRKNIPGLIAAFGQSQAIKEYQLVIAGKKDLRRKEIYQAIKDYQLAEKVHFTGYIREEDLPALYTQAGLLAFPSSYEGFGLPILEAMGCGTPVICSKAASLPEVSGEAAVIIDPADTAGFAKAIDTVLTEQDLRQQLQAKGFQRVKQFTWDTTVKEHIKIYKEALA
ncbi:MAG: glycosyltransferase family 4 protein [Elusimicrobia bacterium]|nr:glycosyltransferase family 4 protein [Elusimicrobiota bacterium]